MKSLDDVIYLSASDLVGHLNCNHLTALDVQVAVGAMGKPDRYDPLLEILRERGRRHEQAYIDHLASVGHDIVKIEGVDITEETLLATREAMDHGAEIIVQAVLSAGRWKIKKLGLRFL